ncbi:ferredoxin--NADP reductase [Amycolatopsis acidicola]|uniref:Ferredoxin--NADP reductase n=1 Tax=Amycolatopsis acidicola TaxID=2596893 RepID=A0A5N0UUY1_9PSEU|nr:ferredoxin--NADP reductase [Amycolatopsis acidicola]KAA9156545.1 ferredoxin--NADP reductase [Amycolatopsis acidicola]
MSSVHFHRLRVAEKTDETHDSCSVTFELAPRQREFFGYRPGQFLTVRIPDGDSSIARCYSLASSPHTGERLRIAVKRVDGGLGSNWICDHVRAGTEIDVLEPAGTFTPKSYGEDHLLFAGGSGITPIMSILRSLLAEGDGRAYLYYANRDEDSVIFKGELKDLQAEHPGRLVIHHVLESVQGLPTAASVQAYARGLTGLPVFICGPKPFMAVVRETLRELGFPREKVRVERFNSLGGNPFEAATPLPPESPEEDAAEVDVAIEGRQHKLAWPRDQRLLDLLVAHGLNAPSSCSEGVCASCECRVLEGEVRMVNNQVLEEEDLADGYVLACQALPITDHIRIEYS